MAGIGDCEVLISFGEEVIADIDDSKLGRVFFFPNPVRNRFFVAGLPFSVEQVVLVNIAGKTKVVDQFFQEGDQLAVILKTDLKVGIYQLGILTQLDEYWFPLLIVDWFP